MNDFINNLDDRDAVRILSVMANAHRNEQDTETELTPELKDALKAFSSGTSDFQAIPEGDMAREMLNFLADDPELRENIRALANGAVPVKMFGIETIAISTAVLIMLKTSVKFKRNPDTTWSLEIIKPSIDVGKLTKLIDKFRQFI